jgi:hypothetical protein
VGVGRKEDVGRNIGTKTEEEEEEEEEEEVEPRMIANGVFQTWRYIRQKT